MTSFRATPDDSTIDSIVLEFLERVDSDTPFDHESFIAENPSYEERLRRLFEDRSVMRRRIDRLAGDDFELIEFDSTSLTITNDPNRKTPSSSSVHLEEQGAEEFAELPVIGRVGNYDLIEEVSRGGMGTIFRARQLNLGRIVALKMIQPARTNSRQARRRFIVEAKAVARLEHRNIVKIHEVGEDAGRLYFSMEFVAGRTLADIIRNHRICVDKAAEYVEKIARAIGYAHRKKVLHRDIKPSNVLIDAEDEPRITDFGVARRLDSDTTLTTTGQLIGTLKYMSPEQATGYEGEVGTSSDIYSIGAILYELLTGRPPFLGVNSFDTMRRIERDDPIPPSRIQKGVTADLEAICLKCLEKRPGDRYATADDLADDLVRYHHDLPTLARPVSRLRRTVKWARRNPSLTALISMAVTCFVMLAAGSLWHTAQLQEALDESNALKQDAMRKREESEKQKRLADLQAAVLRERVYPGDVWRAQQALKVSDSSRAIDLLGPFIPSDSEEDLRGFAWYHLWAQCHSRLKSLDSNLGEAYFVRFSPDGKLLAVGGKNGTVELWNVDDWTRAATLDGHEDCVNCVAFSPDGRWLVTASCDGTVGSWEVKTGSLLSRVPMQNNKVGHVAFAPDGKHIAVGNFEDDSRLELRRFADSEVLKSRFLPGSVGVGSLIFFDEGRRLLATSGKQVSVHEVTDRLRVLHRFKHPCRIGAAALTPQEDVIAVSSHDMVAGSGNNSDIVLYSLDSRDGITPRMHLRDHRASVHGLAFSPDGRLLVSAGSDRMVRLWDVASGQLLESFVGHKRRISSVTFSPDGTFIASSSFDGTTKIWPAEDYRAVVRLPVTISLDETTPKLAFSPDASRLFLAGRETFEAWEGPAWTACCREVDVRWGYPNVLASTGAAHQSDSCRFAVQYDGFAHIYEAWESEPLASFSLNGTNATTLAEGGRWLASSHWAHVSLFDLDRSAAHRKLRGITDITPTPPVTVSPGGTIVAAGDGGEPYVHVWRVTPNGSPSSAIDKKVLRGHTLLVNAVVISPNGRLLASASRDGTTRIWDLNNQKEAGVLLGHSTAIVSVAFSNNGRTVATGGEDGTVYIWDVPTSSQLLELSAGTTAVEDLKFSPDGVYLAALSRDESGSGVVTVWMAARPESLPGRNALTSSR